MSAPPSPATALTVVNVLWDLTCCPPHQVSPLDTLRIIKQIACNTGRLATFQAYSPARRVRDEDKEELERAGVTLREWKDAGEINLERIITVDLFSAALDHPDSTIYLAVPNPMAYTLAIAALSKRHYRVTLIGVEEEDWVPPQSAAIASSRELHAEATNGRSEVPQAHYDESQRSSSPLPKDYFKDRWMDPNAPFPDFSDAMAPFPEYCPSPHSSPPRVEESPRREVTSLLHGDPSPRFSNVHRLPTPAMAVGVWDDLPQDKEVISSSVPYIPVTPPAIDFHPVQPPTPPTTLKTNPPSPLNYSESLRSRPSKPAPVTPAGIHRLPRTPRRLPPHLRHFIPLIEVLQDRLSLGQTRPARGLVGTDLKKGNPRIYEMLGEGREDFKSYSGEAEREGVVKMGGKVIGTEWIELCPAYRK